MPSSSGSTPVYRNPNSIGSHRLWVRDPNKQIVVQTHTVALVRGEVVGVFPEESSYAESAIARSGEGRRCVCCHRMCQVCRSTRNWRGKQGSDDRSSCSSTLINPNSRVGYVFQRGRTQLMLMLFQLPRLRSGFPARYGNRYTLMISSPRSTWKKMTRCVQL